MNTFEQKGMFAEHTLGTQYRNHSGDKPS